MNSVTPILYVKTGCPWCEEVLEYFQAHKLPFEKITVSGNPAPTMDWDGEVLADFGVDELIPFLRKHGITTK